MAGYTVVPGGDKMYVGVIVAGGGGGGGGDHCSRAFSWYSKVAKCSHKDSWG